MPQRDTTMATPDKLPIHFGTGMCGGTGDNPPVKINTPTELQALLNIFRAHGHTHIDTSRLYPLLNTGGAERLLAQTDMISWAQVDTKAGPIPPDYSLSDVHHSLTASLRDLRLPSVDNIWLHYPERTVPLLTTLLSIKTCLTSQLARQWAIANYSVSEIKEILSICDAHSIPLPVAYQGHYNPLARAAETDLIPLLREHNIAFVAFSPTAGGAFAHNGLRLQDTGVIGQMSRVWWGYPEALEAVAKVQEAVKPYGVSAHEVVLRWVRFHGMLDPSKGDAMVVAASSEPQLEETLTALEKGPLPAELADVVAGVWERVKDKAVGYSPIPEP